MILLTIEPAYLNFFCFDFVFLYTCRSRIYLYSALYIGDVTIKTYFAGYILSASLHNPHSQWAMKPRMGIFSSTQSVVYDISDTSMGKPSDDECMLDFGRCCTLHRRSYLQKGPGLLHTVCKYSSKVVLFTNHFPQCVFSHHI